MPCPDDLLALYRVTLGVPNCCSREEPFLYRALDPAKWGADKSWHGYSLRPLWRFRGEENDLLPLADAGDVMLTIDRDGWFSLATWPDYYMPPEPETFIHSLADALPPFLTQARDDIQCVNRA